MLASKRKHFNIYLHLPYSIEHTSHVVHLRTEGHYESDHE